MGEHDESTSGLHLQRLGFTPDMRVHSTTVGMDHAGYPRPFSNTTTMMAVFAHFTIVAGLP